MNYKPIILVSGEPKSIFFEIFFKTLTKININSPIILIACNELLKSQMKKLKFKKKIKLLNPNLLEKYELNNESINLINVKFRTSKSLKKNSIESNKYIKNCFNIAFKIIKSKITNKFINGPIYKKSFLNKKFFGITEYIADHFSSKKIAMLIYNKNLSVCPITTHLPLKHVVKEINKKSISEKVVLIDQFYKKKIGLIPKIAILGLNPHCESIDKYNEDEKILKPTIKSLIKLNYNVSGPHSADTIFLKNNRKNYNVIIGMYHDQVLTPIKTLYEFNAINITLGLPFIRISPDHGPNKTMLGKNLSNPLSLIKAITFLDKN
jgi:4-hydroxy-L-threonine phosphate dehydrogenase PdxA